MRLEQTVVKVKIVVKPASARRAEKSHGHHQRPYDMELVFVMPRG